MPATYRACMTRLSFLTRSDLDDDPAAVWDSLIESRAADLLGPDGELIGPFNAFVHAPSIGRRLSSLGGHLRFRTSLERQSIYQGSSTETLHEYLMWQLQLTPFSPTVG